MNALLAGLGEMYLTGENRKEKMRMGGIKKWQCMISRLPEVITKKGKPVVNVPSQN